MSSADVEQFHALLIAIDNYRDRPLSGCVNDIQMVSSFLTEKLKIPSSSICKIIASRDGVPRPAEADGRSPTYANLVAALQELAGPKVKLGDRVLIYYSGHGSFQKMPDAESYFEGLVPLDFEQVGLLFDVELNTLLQAIANRSGDLSVILDCCHSAGATREVGAKPDEEKIRYIELRREAPAREVIGTPASKHAAATGDAKEDTPYSVLAACHADEKATECRLPPKVGDVHGLLSSCLFEALAKVEVEALPTLRWIDILEPIKECVFKANANQRPQFLGPKERRVFGGPWVQQDTGYPVRRNPDGSYRIGGGSLAGLGKGAQIAVYGPEPALFPSLNSATDQDARYGVLVVETVQPAESQAWPLNKDAPFDVSPAARGRLIKQGAPELLRVAVCSNLDAQLRSLLAQNRQWDNFLLLPEGDASAEVYVGQYPDGDLWIGDDLNGPGAPFERSSPGPMAQVRRSDCADTEDMSVGLRAGLNHYAQYVIPLRVYRNGGFTLPPNAVEVTVLDANDDAKIQQIERYASLRAEVRRDERGRYRINNDDAIAIHVQNTLPLDLYVSLLLCNLEGKIEFLDGDVVIRARSGKIFWSESVIGQPFRLEAPEGFGWGIDRLVVIATDRKGMDLSMLDQKDTLEEVIREAINSRCLRSQAKNPTELRWAATQTLIQVGSP